MSDCIRLLAASALVEDDDVIPSAVPKVHAIMMHELHFVYNPVKLCDEGEQRIHLFSERWKRGCRGRLTNLGLLPIKRNPASHAV